MPATTSTSRGKSSQQKLQQVGLTTASSQTSSKTASSSIAVKSAGFLVTCDPPTKQFIKSLDKSKSTDKKFILEDLDPNHLLIDGRAKDEILREIERWMDENVFTNVVRVGENLET